MEKSTLSQQELEPLGKIAAKEKVAVITFIAAERAIRLSPVSYSFVEISSSDAYRLEEAVDNKCKDIDNAFILLHSPGGSLSSSYNIARFLRAKFKSLHIFVPYEAASGATLMSLAGNKITLGDLGYLTPIDPQVLYKGEWVSSYAVVEEVRSLEEKFKNMRPDEMPVPWRQMAEKLDIILYREMDTRVWEAFNYAKNLLTLAGYDPKVAKTISFRLARNPYTHLHCFDRVACEEMGLNIDNTANARGYLAELKKLIHIINEKPEVSMGHEIEIVLPDSEKVVEGINGQKEDERVVVDESVPMKAKKDRVKKVKQ